MIKKVVLIYLVIVFLLVGVYFVDSLFLGGVTGFSTKEVDIENLVVNEKKIEVETGIVNEDDGITEGNLITGEVIRTSDVQKEDPEEETEKKVTGTGAPLKVSVEVVG